MSPRHPLAAVIVPRFDEADAEWLRRIRQAYDPTPPVAIPLHLTLVFPTARLDEATFAAHVRTQVEEVRVFELTLASARAHRDAGAVESLLYLMPKRGAETITGLHERLYHGLLLAERGRDRAYEPHITIGRFDHHDDATAAAALLQRQGLAMHGLAARIDIVRIRGSIAETVEEIRLAG